MIGPLYPSTTKNKIIKQMMCFWIVKSITSLKTPDFTLAPNEVIHKKEEKRSNVLLSYKEFEKEVEEEGLCYALYVQHAVRDEKTPCDPKLDALMEV